MHHSHHNRIVRDFFIAAVIYDKERGTVVADRNGADISDLFVLDTRVAGPSRRDAPIGQFPALLFILDHAVLDLGAKTVLAEPCPPHGKKGIVFAPKFRALVRTLRQDKSRGNIEYEAKLPDAEKLPRLRLEMRAAK